MQIGVGDVENHHADGAIAFGAEETRDDFRAIGEFFGGAFDAVFGGWRNVARERRVIENDRDGGGRHTAFLRNIAQRDDRTFRLATAQE